MGDTVASTGRGDGRLAALPPKLAAPLQWVARHRPQREEVLAPPSALPTDVRLRRRRDTDLAACARLARFASPEARLGGPHAQDRRTWLTGHDVLGAWVAERRGEILGHVALSTPGHDAVSRMRWREVTGRDLATLGEISRFFVRTTVRDHGIGTALLGAATAEAQVNGLVPVLEVVSDDPRHAEHYVEGGWRMMSMVPEEARGVRVVSYLLVHPPL